MPVSQIVLIACLALLATPGSAAAYIGPGAGLSVIGTAVAFVSAILFAIVGFVWYPLKRLIGFFRNGRRRSDGKVVAS